MNKIKPKTIAILTLSAFLFIILIQNTQVVTIQILFWKISMSRIVLLPLVMLVGGIVGFVLGRKNRENW